MRTQVIRVARIPLLVPILLALFVASAATQSQQNSTSQESNSGKSSPNNAEPQTESSDQALQKVLQQMDATARNFQSAQADFVWKMHNSVVNDFVENDTGKIYFRRKSNEIHFAADITPP